MKQKLINVYKFNELKKDVKEKVLNSFRENNDYSFLNDTLIYKLGELLKKYKIEAVDLNLMYSLGYCQGDGLSFTGTYKWKEHTIFISRSGNYYHKHSTDIYFKELGEEYDEDELTELVNEKIVETREKEFKEIYYKICDEIEKEGYKEIEDEDSEETIKEIIKMNGYTFRETGEMENL